MSKYTPEEITDMIEAHAMSMPSEERIKENAKKWFSNLDGVKFSDWPEALLRVTYPIYNFKLTRKDLVQLTEPEKATKEEVHELDCRLYEFLVDNKLISNAGIFAKLVTRSPKDWLINDEHKPDRIHNQTQVFSSLMNSMRTFEDMCMLRNLDEDTFLIVRPYMDFEAESEFRCFVKDGKVIGISQYHYQLGKSDKIKHLVKFTGHKIEYFLKNIVIPNMSVKTFVADLVVTDELIVLLETNPYGLSDPCLFNSYKELEESEDIFRIHE